MNNLVVIVLSLVVLLLILPVLYVAFHLAKPQKEPMDKSNRFNLPSILHRILTRGHEAAEVRTIKRGLTPDNLTLAIALTEPAWPELRMDEGDKSRTIKDQLRGSK